MVRSAHRLHSLVVSRVVCYSRNYSCSGIDNPGKAVDDKICQKRDIVTRMECQPG